MGEIRRVIGENIKKLCALKGIKQLDIATHLGVSQGSVSNWIKGTNSIDIENLAKLCLFLGVSLDQVYGLAPITQEAILSKEEAELLNLYRSLTKEGQDIILGTIRTFAGNLTLHQEDLGSGNAAKRAEEIHPVAEAKHPHQSHRKSSLAAMYPDDVTLEAAFHAPRGVSEDAIDAGEGQDDYD